MNISHLQKKHVQKYRRVNEEKKTHSNKQIVHKMILKIKKTTKIQIQFLSLCFLLLEDVLALHNDTIAVFVFARKS